MQIGCCCPIEQAEEASAAGFDYLECPLISLQAEQDDAAFAPILARYQTAALPVRAFNVFLPGDLKIVGADVDNARVQLYVETALPRARQIGARLVVFGSGTARAIPAGFPREQALEQLVSFLHLVAEVAAANEITIAIEPLNRKESNVINSVAEGVVLAAQVNRAPIRVLADFYHMDEENEPLNHISQSKEWLAHIHVADSRRLAPGTGQYPYAVFAQELRQAGYDGRVSIECRWNDFAAEAGPAVQFLRQALK